MPGIGHRRPRGSSPLTRGKRHPTTKRRSLRRLIPAHAGKTAPRSNRVARLAAHPRSRGENAFESMGGGQGIGSSPLTRGKPSCIISMRVRIRLIPAHAGKTDHRRVLPLPRRAHPRSRGENLDSPRENRGLRGSSPLTRGKPRIGSLEVGDDRLIPAHAGKTTAFRPVPRGTTAHPRSRGENW